MNRSRLLLPMVFAAVLATFVIGCRASLFDKLSGSGYIEVEPFGEYQTDGTCVEQIRAIRTKDDSGRPLYERYRDVRVIDVHNHDAPRAKYALKQWDQ